MIVGTISKIYGGTPIRGGTTPATVGVMTISDRKPAAITKHGAATNRADRKIVNTAAMIMTDQ